MCAADRDGMLVSLIQSNFSGAGSRAARRTTGASTSTTAARRSCSTTRTRTASVRGKMPMHTLIPALALRDGQPWLVFGTEGGHGQAQTHLQLLDAHGRRRRRPAGSDHRAAVHDRSRHRPRRDRRPLRRRVDRRAARAAATRSTSCRATATVPGIAHAIECARSRLPRRLRSTRRRRHRRACSPYAERTMPACEHRVSGRSRT